MANGYLRDREVGLPARWTSVLFSEQPPEATVSLDTRPGAVTFRRMGSAHARAVLSQPLDFDLWDYEKVVLSAEIRVLGHTLSGGGQLGTEYPILMRVEYTDDQGRRVDWYRGYYLHNREAMPMRSGTDSGNAWRPPTGSGWKWTCWVRCPGPGGCTRWRSRPPAGTSSRPCAKSASGPSRGPRGLRA